MIISNLVGQQNRSSTAKNYLRIWRQFNSFVISLDNKPREWEQRVTLYVAFLIEKGLQSSTVKSYISAIKRILIDDSYPWEDKKILLNSLTRSCRLINDRVQTRLPITCGLLELVLFEIQRIFNESNQEYLESLYKALFILGYYGLFRVGELTLSPHVIKAKNIHMAKNKDKILVVLYSSKTHGKESRPQKVKIVANHTEKSGAYAQRHFCPFKVMREFLAFRGSYEDDQEPLFVYRDRSPVTAKGAREVLKTSLMRLNLDYTVYNVHSLRIGRTSDLVKFNYPISEVKLMGRWRSNCVYKYIRN